MTTPPMAETARFIARILANRPTSQQEVPDLIRGIHETLASLQQPAMPVEPLVVHEARTASAPRRRRRPAAAPRSDAPPPPPPPAPKLLRRAEVMNAPPSDVTATPRNAVRGIVKWFDRRTGKGALRLPGCSSDVPVDTRILTDAGIARLYKGQEVEATIAGSTAAPELVRLALPGASAATATDAGIVHGRRAKPVVVELKREALRRAAARAEAEHVLGSRRPR